MRRSLGAVLAVMISLSSAHARAQGATPAPSKEAVREAEGHFKRGVELYGERDYKGALVEFKRAYQIAPSPSVLYNIGQTQFQLQSYAAALPALEQYAAEGKPTGARKKEVEASIATLRARVGTLDIASNVEGADVTVDEESVGKTPLPKPVLVSVGTRKIVVSAEGFPPATRSVDVAAGDALHLSVELTKPPPPPPPPPSAHVEPPEDDSSSNVDERPGKTYYFIGARYRGTIIPKAIVNMFVDEGRTIYSNTVGIELDIRRDGFSIIPGLTFVEYGQPDTLFIQKGKDPTAAGNWSNVRSSLKGLFITGDLLWSAKISRHVDFEFGAGIGAGLLFGDLETNWVYDSPNGPYETSGGRRFSPCITEADAPSCQRASHQNAQVAKVNHYVEPSWFDGGSRPSLFVHLSIPQVGLRIKPIRELETRVGLGLSLVGLWFGLSADYGLERKPATPPK